MNIFDFLLEYLKSPRTVGAIMPSSEILAEKMVSNVDFKNAECIIEYGPGTGVFTDKLIERKKQDTMLLLFECNKEFCKQLEEKYREYNNIILINDSAENVDKYLTQYKIRNVDYIVSGLPFASLPKTISNEILIKTKQILKKDGLFITFQYTLLRKEFLSKYFKKINLEKVKANVPPAYVFKCNN